MTLTQKEYEQLRAIQILLPWCKWVVRNKGGALYGCNMRPYRDIDSLIFRVDSGYTEMITVDILPSLTWESEPLNIDEAFKAAQTNFDHWKETLAPEFIAEGNFIMLSCGACPANGVTCNKYDTTCRGNFLNWARREYEREEPVRGATDAD